MKKMLSRMAGLGVWLACVTSVPAARAEHSAEQIRAISFLGSVDCVAYPEAQAVLIDALLNDPVEKVRCAACKALTEQLQRGKPPLDPGLGWRPFPDPEILRKIAAVIPGRQKCLDEGNTTPWISKKDRCRYDVCCGGCCNEKVIAALAKVAYGMHDNGCFIEPSERIRECAKRALRLCCEESMMTTMATAPPGTEPYVPPPVPPTTPETPSTTPIPPQPAPPTPPLVQAPQQFAPATSGFLGGYGGAGGNTPLMLGRADATNRLNVFDNGSAQPLTRLWFGMQYVESQNTGITSTSGSDRLIAAFNSGPNGPQIFKSFTGYNNPNEFLQGSGSPGQKFEQVPNGVLYRFGYEYAMTKDFSVGMMAQYVQPTSDVGQSQVWSNPLVTLKHVLYRSEKDVFSAVLGISPRIPQPRFGITEATTRIIPSLMAIHKFNDQWFFQGAAQINAPTEHHNIATTDWAAAIGYWAYQHPSLRDSTMERPWLLGVVPSIEVLGKHVLTTTSVPGQFGISTASPQTKPGTVSPVDGSTNIYFPDDPSQQFGGGGVFTFNEPRHVIDITVGASLLFKHNIQWSNGISFPVTAGAVRKMEYLSTLNFLF